MLNHMMWVLMVEWNDFGEGGADFAWMAEVSEGRRK